MGRRNKCKTPLTKQENRLKKDGRLSITGVGQSTQYFPAKAGDAHAQDYGDGSDLSSIHAGPLAEFLGKEWRWGNPDKPIPHKAVYYASRACLGGNHPRHWVPRVH